MRIAVIGATGVVGGKVVQDLCKEGHEVIAISRHGRPVRGATSLKVDTVTGEGLPGALDGCEAVIDTTNSNNLLDLRVFTIGARNVVAEAEKAGVERAVVLSIVGTDKSDFVYHQRKLDQERIYLDSHLETTIVRATQFHEFPTDYFEKGSALGAIPVFLGARFQTVDSYEVADLLAAEALNPSGKRRVEIGGPKVWVSRDMARVWQSHTRARGLIVNGPFPPSLLKFYREGNNLSGDGHKGVSTYENWLKERDYR